MAKSAGRNEQQYRERAVVSDMHKEAGSDRFGQRSYRRQCNSHQEDNQNGPGILKLSSMQKTERHRSEQDARHHPDSARQNWIQEAAEEEFLHEGRHGDGKDRHQHGLAWCVKKTVDGQMLRNRQKLSKADQRKVQDGTSRDKTGPGSGPIPANGLPEASGAHFD